MINRLKNKREYPRIEHTLPVKLAVDDYLDFSTETKNLSCFGAYCNINKYIPPFTRLRIKLFLPVNKDHDNIECAGVIVRTEDDIDGGFNIAIFFNQIKEPQRKKISQYVHRFLPA